MTLKNVIVTFALLMVGVEGTTTQDLTLEEKIGQLLMVHFNGEVANNDASTLINEIQVGGFIYYKWSNSLNSPEQVCRLSSGLQSIAKNTPRAIPLFIAVDQEGGRIERVSGLTPIPSSDALGKTASPSIVKSMAYQIGNELLAIGINLNLAPVVDINCNPNNIVIGDRSFGDNPELVFRMGKAALQGFHESRILSCLKHFPGYGDVSVDPHEALPIVNKTREELNQTELLPFSQLASQCDCIMTAHILVPALDPHKCSTLSKRTIDILRNEMNFSGVIITDSLIMEGLLQLCPSIEEAAIQAFLAGNDILLLGGKLLNGSAAGRELSIDDIKRVRDTFLHAVKNNRITEERVDESVNRILLLKNKLRTKQ